MTNYCGNVESRSDDELLIQPRITFRRWTDFQRWMTISAMDGYCCDEIFLTLSPLHIRAIKAHCLPCDSSLKDASPWCRFALATNVGSSRTEFSEWLLVDVGPGFILVVGPRFNSTSPSKSKRKNKEKLETLT